MGRPLCSYPRSQKRSATAGACAPKTWLVSHSRTGPPETNTASRLPVTVASRPGRLATVTGRREAVFVSGGPVLECDTSHVFGAHAPAAADRFGGRGYEHRERKS